MSWKPHISEICQKIRHVPYVIKKIRNYFTLPQLKQIYNALFLSVATYGIISWGGTTTRTLLPLEIIHKKVIKYMFGLNIRHSTSDLFNLSGHYDMKVIFC